MLSAESSVTRYPEDIKALIKSFTKSRVEDYLQKTKRLLRWLKKDTERNC